MMTALIWLKLISAACSCLVTSTLMGTPLDRATWSYVLDPSDTPDQVAAAVAFAQGFDYAAWQAAQAAIYEIPTAIVLGRLTDAEYTAIMQAAAASLAAGQGQLSRWLDQARTSQGGIGRSDPATLAAIGALEGAGLLSADRVAIVFARP